MRNAAFGAVDPMLCQPGPVPAGDGWSYEVKWDGARALVAVDDGAARLYSRNGHDVTARYPELARPPAALRVGRWLLDAELVCLDETTGLPDLRALQRRMQRSGPQRGDLSVRLFAFDLLWHPDGALLDEPYRARRELLSAVELGEASWRAPAPLKGTGAVIFEHVRVAGLEGVVSKRLDSRYEPGRRSGAWVKTKVSCRQDFVVGGVEAGRGSRSLGALLLGVYDAHDRLRYAGSVGTGFSEADLDELHHRLVPLAHPHCPFDPALPRSRGVVYLRPQLVITVRFLCWTPDGKVREPVYVAVRDDVTAGETRREDALA